MPSIFPLDPVSNAVEGSAKSVLSPSEAIKRVQDNIVKKFGNEQDKAEYALSNIDLNNPISYMTAAYDVANWNTQQSQALAREQMAFQEKANAKLMDFNSSEALKVRDWEKMMSDTAHQREVNDLIKAGLNPVLSANQGASTPSVANAVGATSSGAKGTVDTSTMQAIMSAYQTAWNMKIQEKQIDAQLAMNMLNNETTRYAADKGAYGAVTAASLNSSANRYAADINKMIYEEGWHGMGSVVGNIFDNLLGDVQSLIGSGQQPIDAVRDYLLENFPWAEKQITNIFGEKKLPGRTSQAGDYDGTGYRSNNQRSGGGHFSEE